MNKIHLYDTYTRKKRLFISKKPKEVGIYTCGPTVYDYPHIGNLRAYVFADILRRMFEFNQYEVRHVINITDVGHLSSDADEGEDKVEAKARKKKQSALKITNFFTKIFKDDLKNLNIKQPTIWSKATEHIKEQITLIKRLEDLGYTYRIKDGIYFDTSKFPKYGHLGRLDIEGMIDGMRIGKNLDKRRSTDFALWKFSPKDKKRQMEWKSPWGIGFPGWHIECSAMAMKYLGDTIDVHTGGIDHIPVHHTNEIAQSEAATRSQFVRYWMHVAFLKINSEKMAKSERNYIILKDIINKSLDPLSFRYLLLTAKYRAGLNFTWESLGGAQKALISIRHCIKKREKNASKPDQVLMEEFKNYINDDLNTPKAIALIWKILDMPISYGVKRATIVEMDKVLGLDLIKTKVINIPSEIKCLAKKRDTLRKEKKWAEADNIRVDLKSRGYQIDDTSKSYKIRKIV